MSAVYLCVMFAFLSDTIALLEMGVTIVNNRKYSEIHL